MILTKIDDLVALLENKKRLSMRDAAKALEWDEASVERVAGMLEKQGIMDTHYPVNIFARPWVSLRKHPGREEQERIEGEEVESYALRNEKGDFLGTVRLVQRTGGKRARYFAILPKVSRSTRAYLQEIKTDISRTMQAGGAARTREEMEKEFYARKASIRERIEKDLAVTGTRLGMMTSILHSEMFGLGDIEALVGDYRLEEIVINSCKIPVLVYHRKHGWMKTNLNMHDEEDTENLASQIARRVGKQITVLSPVLDAHLLTGDRVNATLFPISSKGNTITLRLFARNPWTITNYLTPQVHAMSYDMAALLWQAVHYEMNILVAGGTASGKTSALNGIVALTPPFQRVITIEDTRELALPSYQWNWVPLATRPPNPEGVGEVKMLDLLVNSLRMRPDRIVMGEIRRKKEAEVLFEAMHTGHSVYATMHADTGAQVIKRLIEPPIAVPESEVEEVHLLLVQYRDRRRNVRRTLELCEVVPGAGGPELNHLYRWNVRSDEFTAVKPPHRYAQQMNLHTGMTDKEIAEDQASKRTVLKWMVEHGLDQVDDVGKVMRLYYTEEETILGAAEKNRKPEEVL